MSLVTTAISNRSRRRLHSASTRAVLPEPTGPPTPTRNTCSRFDAFMASSTDHGPRWGRLEHVTGCEGTAHVAAADIDATSARRPDQRNVPVTHRVDGKTGDAD